LLDEVHHYLQKEIMEKVPTLTLLVDMRYDTGEPPLVDKKIFSRIPKDNV
jgi:hypothetical protein